MRPGKKGARFIGMAVDTWRRILDTRIKRNKNSTDKADRLVVLTSQREEVLTMEDKVEGSHNLSPTR